jgi:2',3'-cyclic-nucleotide 2'-phosphodiesterase (5'-nucleotidase family)
MKKYLFFLLFSIILAQESATDNVQNISIVSTTNVYSEFYDCGCPKNPRGGIARKAFFTSQVYKGDHIQVDAGNSLFDSNLINPDGLSVAQKKYKARNFVKALEFINQDIVNIGSNDFKGGVDFLKEITSDSSVKFISANLYDESTKKLLFKPYHIVEKDGAKIAFIGLSQSARFSTIVNKNFIEEGNRYIKELKPSVDIIVLLVNVRGDNVIDLSNAFPGADHIFLSGDRKRTMPNTLQSEKGPLVYSGDVQGKFLSILFIRIKDKGNPLIDISKDWYRLQSIQSRLDNLQSKDKNKSLEDIYANDPNVLQLIKKWRMEATKLGLNLNEIRNFSRFYSVPLEPFYPDDKKVAAFIENIASNADFPLKHEH